MHNAQCTMNNYTAKHGTMHNAQLHMAHILSAICAAAWPSHNVQLPLLARPLACTMYSLYCLQYSLTLFGVLQPQCSVNIHFPLCAAFNVHCLQYFLAASDMKRYFLLRSGPARTSVCNINRVVCSQTVFNVVLCALVNFHGFFACSNSLLRLYYYCNVWFVKCCVCFQCHM